MDSTTQLLQQIRDAATRIEARQASIDVAAARMEAKLDELLSVFSDDPQPPDSPLEAGDTQP